MEVAMIKSVLLIFFCIIVLMECNALPETTTSHRVARQAENTSENPSAKSPSWIHKMVTWVATSVQKAAEASQRIIYNIVSGVMTSGMPTSGPIQRIVG